MRSPERFFSLSAQRIFWWNIYSFPIYMSSRRPPPAPDTIPLRISRSPTRKNLSTSFIFFNIKFNKKIYGNVICSHILFILSGASGRWSGRSMRSICAASSAHSRRDHYHKQGRDREQHGDLDDET